MPPAPGGSPRPQGEPTAQDVLESSSLPPKLKDCRSTSTDASELFIVRGRLGTGHPRTARNSEFEALLPIRGKILNVQKASVTATC